MTKKENQIRRILAHGDQLLGIFPNCTEKDPSKLWRKLRSIDLKALRIMEIQCERSATDADEAILQQCTAKVEALLGKGECDKYRLFLNHDPRGYTLKLSDVEVKKYNLDIHRDWGGYGILAPDLTEN